MAQFHAYRNPGSKSADRAPYLLDIQSDFVNLKSRVMVMLVRPDHFGPRMRSLNPLLTVNGESVVMSPTEMGSIQSRRLGEPVASLAGHRQDIMAALDLLLTGI